MNCLTIAGLLLDAIGAVFLVGPEFGTIRSLIINPITNPIGAIIRWSIKSIYEYRWDLTQPIEDQETMASSDFRITPLKFFVDKHSGTFEDVDTLETDKELIVKSGHIIVDYEASKGLLQREHIPKVGAPSEWEATKKIDLAQIRGRLVTIDNIWLYQTGIILLLIGFLFQLVAQITPNVFPLLSETIPILSNHSQSSIVCLTLGMIIAISVMWVLYLQLAFISVQSRFEDRPAKRRKGLR